MYFGDSAITMAKQALKIFMHSLPEGSKFNICGFGSSHEFLFKQSVDYTEENLQIALKDIETYDTRERCLGGTEIYSPLKGIFDMDKSKDHEKRQIFLLTDGAVWDNHKVIALVD